MGDRLDSTRIQSCHFGNKEKKGRDLMQLYDKHPLGIRGGGLIREYVLRIPSVS